MHHWETCVILLQSIFMEFGTDATHLHTELNFVIINCIIYRDDKLTSTPISGTRMHMWACFKANQKFDDAKNCVLHEARELEVSTHKKSP